MANSVFEHAPASMRQHMLLTWLSLMMLGRTQRRPCRLPPATPLFDPSPLSCPLFSCCLPQE